MNQHFAHFKDNGALPFIDGMGKDMVDALHGWRLAQDPVPDPKAAILLLLSRALTLEGFLVAAPANAPSDEVALDALVKVFRTAARRL